MARGKFSQCAGLQEIFLAQRIAEMEKCCALQTDRQTDP